MIQMSFFPLLFTSLLFLLMFLKIWKRIKDKKPIPKLPPGPPKFPVLGNLHQLIWGKPHHALRDLARRYGPIMHLKLGEVSAVIISSPDAAKQVLKTHELSFPQRPGVIAVEDLYGRWGLFFAPYGDYWKYMRKMSVTELLSVKRVQSFSCIREEEVWSFIESISLSKGQTINLSEKIFSLINNIVARAAFGKQCKQQDEFISFMQEAIKLSSGFDIADLFPSLKFVASVTGMKAAMKRLFLKIDRILEDIINDHKVKRKTRASHDQEHDEKDRDLLDLLLDLQESTDAEFNITTDQLKANILEIFGAGSETSATTLEWAVSELLRNPRARAKAQAEVREAFGGRNKIKEADVQKLKYLKLVIKETVRLHTPAAIIPREAIERCEVSGYEIASNTKLFINAWAIARDEKYWENADCFEPERFLASSIDFKGNNFEFLPFGAGRRMCPGIPFATAQIEMALALLLYHFDWQLPNKIELEKLDMTEGDGITIRRKNDLYLVPSPCIPFVN